MAVIKEREKVNNQMAMTCHIEETVLGKPAQNGVL